MFLYLPRILCIVYSRNICLCDACFTVSIIGMTLSHVMWDDGDRNETHGIMWSDACVLIPFDVNMQYMRIKIMERQAKIKK